MFQKLRNIGPGAMVAAAFIGPGTVTTATIAGAGYGYTLLWAILFSIVATYLLQEMAARLGVVGGLGLGEALRKKIDNKVLRILASILVISAILIGNAAYEAGNIVGAVLGFEDYTKGLNLGFNPLIILIGITAFYLLYSGRFRLIERSLIVMVSIMGLVFIIAAIVLQPDLMKILEGIFIPKLPESSLLMVIGLIGTTVVPYNLFLHASSVKQRWSGPEDLAASRWDTTFSVVLGGIITMAILICAAVAFEGTDGQVNSAADLSRQLKPILGNGAGLFIAFGFLAAGLSSSVTAPLAAAFATSEILGWRRDLKGRNFRFAWGFVLLFGLILSFINLRPTTIIFMAQVANGLLLPIIAAFLVWIMNDRSIMGKYTNTRFVNIAGWLVILITIGLGVKGILGALNIL